MNHLTFTVSVCGRGNYWNTTIHACRRCPTGTYSDTDDADSCTKCPGEQTTSLEGSSNVEQCRKRMQHQCIQYLTI